MPDREKVIKGLECCVTMPDIYPRCEECPYADADGTCANMNGLHRDALALLKAQEPRVMTLEEVVTRRGEPVWFESKSGRTYNGYVLVYDVQEGLGITGVRVGITQPGHTTIWPSKDIYGVKWRCWTSRPTDEQREATPWQTPSINASAQNG